MRCCVVGIDGGWVGGWVGGASACPLTHTRGAAAATHRVDVVDGVGDGGLGGAHDEVDQDLKEAAVMMVCKCGVVE